MTLKDDTDLAAFLAQVQCCEGEVYYKTEDGDCLNLKSELAKMVFMTVIAERISTLGGDIACEDEGDRMRLSAYWEE